MFARIARRYDLLNRLMTGAQDVRWRKLVAKLAQLPHGACLLDIGAGTGDLAREARKQQATAKVAATDFSLEMMRAGQLHGTLNWCAADALQLPFGAQSFDAVVSGFLMRNVENIDRALGEQYRVLARGGRIVILDTTRLRQSALSPLIHFHLHVVIPTISGLLTGARDAYEYLPDSTENFLSAEELAAKMREGGFQNIGFRILMFGTMAIHWGERTR